MDVRLAAHAGIRGDLDGRDESIAASRDRLDEARRCRRIAERLAKMFHARIQAVLEVDVGVFGPELAAEVVARDEDAARFDQGHQPLIHSTNATSTTTFGLTNVIVFMSSAVRPSPARCDACCRSLPPRGGRGTREERPRCMTGEKRRPNQPKEPRVYCQRCLHGK